MTPCITCTVQLGNFRLSFLYNSDLVPNDWLVSQCFETNKDLIDGV